MNTPKKWRGNDGELICPRCGRGLETGEQWPDCLTDREFVKEDHGRWCQDVNYSNEICPACEVDMALYEANLAAIDDELNRPIFDNGGTLPVGLNQVRNNTGHPIPLYNYPQGEDE